MRSHRALFAIVVFALGIESASAACQRLPDGKLYCGVVQRRDTLGIPPPAPGPINPSQGQQGPIYQGQQGPIYQGQQGPIYQGQQGPIYQGQQGPIYQGQQGPIYQGQQGPIYQGQYSQASACFNPWGYCALTDFQSVGDSCWCVAPNGQPLMGVAR
jgi:hypothetical protein